MQEGISEVFLKEVYFPHHVAVKSQIRNALFPRQEAVEDIFNEVFFKAFRNWPYFRGDSSVGTWLFRISSNTVKDHFRKDKMIRLREDPIEGGKVTIQFRSPNPDPYEVLLCQEMEWTTEKCLDSISEKSVVAWRMKQIGYSSKEIADELDCTEIAAKNRVFLTRKALRKKLKEVFA